MENATSQFSVVIPVYNSQATLGELIARLAALRDSTRAEMQVILVNDGSRDASWAEIRRLAAQYPWVRGLDLMRNYGQHNALLAGIRAARYGVIVTMDDDLQHPPEEIPQLLAKLDQGYDVVYGTPLVKRHSLGRVVAAQLSKFIIRTTVGVDTASKGSAFRAFRAQLREAFADYASPYVLIDVLLSWGTLNFGAVPVRHAPRRVGKSNYNLLRLLALALDMTTGFSTWPLRVASLIGFGVTLLGAGLLIFVLALYVITGEPVSVYRFLVAVLAIFSGAQLFALGIIGEYLARMHLRVMARPPYAVRADTQPISESEVTRNV